MVAILSRPQCVKTKSSKLHVASNWIDLKRCQPNVKEIWEISVSVSWITMWKKGILFVDVNLSIPWHQSDGLVQERCNSSALAMELRLSCTNPSSSTCVCMNSSMWILVQIYVHWVPRCLQDESLPFHFFFQQKLHWYLKPSWWTSIRLPLQTSSCLCYSS